MGGPAPLMSYPIGTPRTWIVRSLTAAVLARIVDNTACFEYIPARVSTGERVRNWPRVRKDSSMFTTIRSVATVLVVGLLAAACGGGTTATSATPGASTTTAPPRPPPAPHPSN